jgi:hypothetical protein
MILMIAGNRQQANLAAKNWRLGDAAWRYVNDVVDMQDLDANKFVVWVLGTYFMNKSSVNAIQYAKEKGFPLIKKV